MTDSQQKVLDWLREQRSGKSWFRPSEMTIPDYPASPSSIGIVLRALVAMGKVEMQTGDRGNGTQCKEYRAVPGPDPHKKKKDRKSPSSEGRMIR